MMTVPNRIREIRKAKGLSLDMVAERVNASASAIARLERGEREVTISWMNRLAKAMGVSPVHILPAEMSDDSISPFEVPQDRVPGFEWADRAGLYVTPWPVQVRREADGFSPHGCAWFGLEFLAKFNIDPNLCEVVEIRDSSMSPVLPNGGVALVDLARSDLFDRSIYAAERRDGSELLLRRARRTSSHHWHFVAEAKGWPKLADDDVEVKGRVVWAAFMVTY